MSKRVSDGLPQAKENLKKIGIDVDRLVSEDLSQSSLKLSLKSSERLISNDLGFFGAYLSPGKKCFVKPKETCSGTWETSVADQKGVFRFRDGKKETRHGTWEISVADQKGVFGLDDGKKGTRHGTWDTSVTEQKGVFRFDDGEKGTHHGAWDISVADRKGKFEVYDGTWEISVADQKGEFRFDDGEYREVDEFVAIVAADKISKPKNPFAFFLGLVTKDGISTRVGIGFIDCAEDLSSLKERWQYKFFRIS